MIEYIVGRKNPTPSPRSPSEAEAVKSLIELSDERDRAILRLTREHGPFASAVWTVVPERQKHAQSLHPIVRITGFLAATSGGARPNFGKVEYESHDGQKGLILNCLYFMRKQRPPMRLSLTNTGLAIVTKGDSPLGEMNIVGNPATVEPVEKRNPVVLLRAAARLAGEAALIIAPGSGVTPVIDKDYRTSP